MKTKQYAIPNEDTVYRLSLPNGLTILAYENPHVELVVLKGSLLAGAAYESFELSGMASVTASLLLSGTESRDFDSLNGALEDIGAELEFRVGKHRLSFTGQALKEDLSQLLDVLADALRYPVFPDDEVIQEQKKRLTELNYAHQNTRYMASQRFREALYPPNHSYHYSTYGSLDSLPRMNAEEIRRFHAANYSSERMILVLVGAIHAETAAQMVADALGDWQTSPKQHPRFLQVASPQGLNRLHTPIVGKTQSDIVMGTFGPARKAPEYEAAVIANSILGEFGLMGRIGLKIREELGLAYYVYSRLESSEEHGTWQISAGVAPENVDLCIEKIREEIALLRTDLISLDDLADNLAYFSGRLPLRIENSSGIASLLHNIERYGLGLNYLLTYSEQLAHISREDILATVQRYLHPDNLVISVAG